MNLKEYISSGIVETYVLGIATDAEREEFETMCKLHPEVEQARQQLELILESQLLQEAVLPPPQVKNKILEFISNTDAANATVDQETDETPVRRLSIWKIMAAASVLLLAGALFWAITANTKYQQAQLANADLKRQVEQKTTRLNQLENDAQLMQNPAVKMSALLSPGNSNQCMAHVYWDTASKDTYILINNLPLPASDKQYQLWALIDNKPIDLGVFDVSVKEQRLLVKTKNTQNAEAFAITLEPRGGSAAPTLEAMYAIGKL